MRIHPGDQANITVRIDESKKRSAQWFWKQQIVGVAVKTLIVWHVHIRYIYTKYINSISYSYSIYFNIKYNTRHCLMWNPYHNLSQNVTLSMLSNLRQVTRPVLQQSVQYGILPRYIRLWMPVFVASIRWGSERSLSKLPWLEWIRTPRFPGYLGLVGKHC